MLNKERSFLYSASIAVLVLLSSLLLYWLVMRFVGWEELDAAADKVEIKYLLLMCIFTCTSLILRFIRWALYLGILGHRMDWWRNLLIYFSGFSLTASPGKSGELLRAYFYRFHHIDVTDTVTAFFSERFCDLVSVTLLAGIGALALGFPLLPTLFLLTFLMVVFSVIVSPIFENISTWLLDRVKANQIRRFIIYLRMIKKKINILLNLRFLVVSILAGSVIWVLPAIGVYFMISSISEAGMVSPMEMVGIFSISSLAGALSMIPGGFGGHEATFSVLLSNLGFTLSVGALIVFLSRLTTLWLATVLGALSIVILFCLGDYRTLRTTSVLMETSHG